MLSQNGQNSGLRFVKLYRKGTKANSPLLVSERGGRIIYRSVYAKVKRIGEQAGVGKLHPVGCKYSSVAKSLVFQKLILEVSAVV